jgi:hypothetical protein
MRIEFDIVTDGGAAQTVVLGDDSRGLAITGYTGPRAGIEVDRIRKARAVAVKLGRISARAYDVPFQVQRQYANSAERLFHQHTHAQEVCRKGVLRVVDNGVVYAVACCFACEPTEMADVAIKWSYAFATEDWKY